MTTAAQAYEALMADVETLIGKLPAAVEAYDRRRSTKAGASSDWGYAGDLEAVKAQLREALRVLGAPQPVGESEVRRARARARRS